MRTAWPARFRALQAWRSRRSGTSRPTPSPSNGLPMSPPDPRCGLPPAALTRGAAGEGGPAFPGVDADREGRTIELATSEFQIEATSSSTIPDEVGPTVAAIPIRNQLAAARIAHAFSNAREAQALID